MQRSNTITNFLESKTKKKWSNPFSSKSPRDSLTRDSRSPSVSSISSSNAMGAIPRSQSTLRVNSSSSTTSDIKRRNRSSLMISSNNNSDRSSITQKHKSYIGFGSLRVDPSTVTDPKELEFYNQLLNSSKSAGTITEEGDEDDDHYTADNSSFSVFHASDEMSSTATPTTAISSREGTPKKNSIPETLTSALEDYHLFTKRNTLIITPTTPIFSSTTVGVVEEDCNLSSSNSLPSLSSFDSIESVISVMKVSNSLWVGITDEEEMMKCDALDGFDAEDVFNDVVDFHVVRFTQRASHRTSLIFA